MEHCNKFCFGLDEKWVKQICQYLRVDSASVYIYYFIANLAYVYYI